MIKVIILDLGNVLAEFAWEDYLISCGYDQELIRRISNATVRNKIWKEWDRSVIKKEDLIEQCCSQEPELEKEIRNFFDHILSMVKEYDYSASFVKQLKDNGYKVYLLSNYSKWHFENDRSKFTFLPYFDGGLVSYEIHHIKPEAEIYESLLSKYNIDPKEAVFIDDVAENLEGAKPFGISTIQFISYEQTLNDLRKLGIRI